MGKFERLIETADALIIGLDLEGRITLFNRHCQEVTGYSEDEVLGRKVWDFLLPERFIGPVKEVFRSIREDQLPSRLENPWLTKEGEERYISWSNTNIKDEEGRIVEIFGIGIDITEQKRAEEKLKESERELQQIINSTSEIIFRVDLNGNYTFANKAAERLTGYSLDELLKMNMSELVAPEYLQSVVDRLEKRIAGEPLDQLFDFEIVHKDGHRITVELSTVPIYGTDGELTGVQGIARDITEHKKMEEEIWRLKEFNENIIRNVNEGILIEDAAGYVTFANPKMTEMLGRTEEELIGAHWTEIVPAEYVKLVSEELGKRSRGVASQYEAALLPKGGDELPVLISARPLFDEGRYVGTLSVFTDISERKKAEEMKAEFISTVSHELRTPLTSIKGYADLLLAGDAGKLNDAQKGFLQVIVRNSARLTKLLNELLDLERIESGEIKLELRELRLDEILRDVAETFRVNAEKKGLSFEAEIEEGIKVEGDADYLAQACANLLSNAIKYTKEGFVRLRTKSERGRAIIEVEDSGIGMSEEELSQLFKRFFRADNPYVKEAGGTGLGLSIVRSIIERHGGEITVESEPNGGSTFTVSLPLLESWTELERMEEILEGSDGTWEDTAGR